MQFSENEEKIKEIASALDDAIESKNYEEILSYFADDCEIELLGLEIKGKENVKKWLNWMFSHIKEIRFEPVLIMIQGNSFFEELVVKAELHNGASVTSKQSEVLIYEELKVKSLRLYFDRLDFADSFNKGFLNRYIIKKIIKRSLKGLN